LNFNPEPAESGRTESERYLAALARKALLSLWAYPNVHTDESKPAGKGAGHELCDLLVIFGNNVLIFSDKHVRYKDTGNPSLDWNR
jgi:hypothetical protein